MKKTILFFVLINFISIIVLQQYDDSAGIIMKFLMILSALTVVHSIALMPIIYMCKKNETKTIL